MAANPQIIVEFIAKTADLNKGISEADGKAKGFGKSIGGMGKAAIAAGGAAGLGILTSMLKTGSEELAQSAKVGAQTDAVIKSTGQSAGVSAKQVESLAGALMKKSGMDDEAIQSGENLLLTFTKVQNKAGAGNDIFNRATQTMLDMSTALGQDTKSSAIQLGKALNDPIKGVTALQRVGVSFTAAQKKQIAALVASGDTMGAQKLILGELNKEFGGSAEAAGKTLPGQLAVLKESYSNLAGSMIGSVAPAFQAITGFLVKHPGLMKALVIGIAAVSAAMVVMSVAMLAAAAAEAAVLWPVLAVIAVLVALIAIVVLVVKNRDTIRAAASSVWNAVKDAVVSAMDAVKGAIAAVWDWISGHWPLLLGILAGPFGLAIALIATHWDAIKGAITTALSAISSAVETAWNAIKTLITSVSNAVKSAVETAWGGMKTAMQTASSAVKTAVETAWNAIKTVITTVVGAVTGTIKTLANLFETPAKAAKTMLGDIKSAFEGIDNAISGVVAAVGRAAQKVANAIMAPINAAKGVVNGILKGFNALRIPGFSVTIPGPCPIPDVHFGWGGMDLPDIPLLAKGGVISGPTLAMLGEGRGREIVAPESLLRSILGEQSRPVNVRVFIGETELRGMVRTEIVQSNTGLARTLLAGGRG